MLASASSRRARLLADAGLEFTVVPADVDETPRPGEDGRALACRLALDKAAACARRLDATVGTVLAGDTVVWCDGRSLAKPADEAEARAMLAALSGREHDVISSVALHDLATGRATVDAAVARVRFDALDASTLRRYVEGDEWRGKAGGYAIQGDAGAFAHLVDGDLDTVVGLSIDLVADLVTRWDPSS